MNHELLQQEFDRLNKDERHLNKAETAYWCSLYKRFARYLLAELAKPEQDSFNRLIRIMGTFDLATGHADGWDDLLDSLESELRDVLGHYREALKAKPEQDHCFDRTASHMAGEYVDTSEERVHKSDKAIHEMQRLGQELEQEPVAWMYNGHLHECDPSDWALDDVIPLYTSPPRKEWVGLTDDEFKFIASKYRLDTPCGIGYFQEEIETKLKEKNER